MSCIAGCTEVGEEVYDEAYSSAIDFAGSRTVIGLHPLNDGYFDGTMDDVRIYDRALSREEIGQFCGAADE